MDDRDHIPMATEEDWDGTKYPSNEQKKGEKRDSYFGYGYDKASGGTAGPGESDGGSNEKTKKKKLSWDMMLLLAVTMVVVAGFIVSTVVADNQKQSAIKKRQELIEGFNSAMISLDFDEMEKYFDTSATNDDLEDMGEYDHDGHNWAYLKSLEKPYLSSTSFREVLLENNKNITYKIGHQEDNGDGSYDIDVYYDYCDFHYYLVEDVYTDYLIDNYIDDVDQDSSKMEEVISKWYEDIKDADPSALKEYSRAESHVIFRIKDGKILGFAADSVEYDGKEGKGDYKGLEDVMLSDFPYAKSTVEDYLFRNIDSIKKIREERGEKASDSQTDGSGSDAADGSTSDGSAADGSVTGGAATDGSAAGGTATDGSAAGSSTTDSQGTCTERNKRIRMNSNARTGAGSSSTYSSGGSTSHSSGSSKEEVSHDPDDYDIEQYYEDNKNDFENEDDAYDGFIDDEEWEDY